MRNTLADFFEDLAAVRGEFLVHDDGFRTRRYSYAQVAAAARRFAGRLHEAGLRKGDKILIWCENRPEWIAAFWGSVINGVVVVPVDFRSSLEFASRVAATVGARVALVGDDVEEAKRDAVPNVGGALVWRLASVDWTADGPPLAASPAVALDRDDVVEIIFTSGATAEPKGVLITHRNVLANIVPIEREVLKYRRWGRPFFPLRFLNLLPLSHMFGQAMATFIPPMLPGTTIFMRGYNPAEIVAQVKKRRVSVVVSVPKILDVLAEHVRRTMITSPARRPAPPGTPARRPAPPGTPARRPAPPGTPARRPAPPGTPAPQGPTAWRVARRWWRYRAVHRAVGAKFWSFVVGAAPLDPATEEFWSRLGFVVIQGYGLTETAPVVSLNHPFAARSGSVGKAIPGVEVKIAPDGEILVRGENVTRGYFGAETDAGAAFEDGWLHTGDIGEVDAGGRLFVKGRKKEMIVTPEGLNVFPEDVERALNVQPGVRESAVVGATTGGEERVHAVLALEPGADAGQVVRDANAKLVDHQRIRGVSTWTTGDLPRTEGTRKLKRREIRQWVEQGASPPAPRGDGRSVEALLSRYAGGRALRPDTTLEELGLSSLDRVELMAAIDERVQAGVDEARFADARTVADLQALVSASPAAAAGPAAGSDTWTMPAWSRGRLAAAIRRASLATVVLPLTRAFARVEVRGIEHLAGLGGPVVFASNHQSHLDTPVILAALPGRWRRRVAVAMAKEFFAAHFHPEGQPVGARLRSGLLYALAACFFNAFPLPQREAGARRTLRYIGELVSDGWSVLIYPEGQRSDSEAVGRFQPGVGMIGSRLAVPVVPVRLDGVNRVLHRTWKMPRPGRVRVSFGPAVELTGEDYAELARIVEDAVRGI
jgi:long-chain acyl-CoA synthetase